MPITYSLIWLSHRVSVADLLPLLMVLEALVPILSVTPTPTAYGLQCQRHTVNPQCEQ